MRNYKLKNYIKKQIVRIKNGNFAAFINNDDIVYKILNLT